MRFLASFLFIAFVAQGHALLTKVEVCSLEKETGPCRASIPRFYYDLETQDCKQFVYGGCEANENNFETLEACHNYCDETRSKDEICGLPAETGMCMAYIPSYHYNAKTQSCEKFIYGGCAGNDNRFSTLKSCEKYCGGSKHRASSSLEVCSLKPETGLCRAYIPSYYYDSETQTCRQFIYGGCGGNDNRFETLEKCHNLCKGNQAAPTKLEVCSMKAETGPCRAYFPRFYYDSATKSCRKFVYGGCQGNENNFGTIEECHGFCDEVQAAPTKLEVCSMEPETGLCRAHIINYYYDSATKTCRTFVYGGCGGNENNFSTLEECHGFCNA